MIISSLLKSGTVKISKLSGTKNLLFIKVNNESYKFLQMILLQMPDEMNEMADMSEIVDHANDKYNVYVNKHFTNQDEPGILSYVVIERDIGKELDNKYFQSELFMFLDFGKIIKHSIALQGLNPIQLSTKEMRNFLNNKFNYKKFDEYIFYYRLKEQEEEMMTYRRKDNEKPHFIVSSRVPRILVPSMSTPTLHNLFILGKSAEDRTVGIPDLSVLLAGSNVKRRIDIVQNLIFQLSELSNTNVGSPSTQQVIVFDFGLDIANFHYDGPIRPFVEKDLSLDPFLLYDTSYHNVFLTAVSSIFSQILNLDNRLLQLLQGLITSYLENDNNFSLRGFSQYVKQIIGEESDQGGAAIGQLENIAALEINKLIAMAGTDVNDPNQASYEIISRQLNYLISIIPDQTALDLVLDKPGLTIIKLSNSIIQIKQIALVLFDLHLRKSLLNTDFTSPYIFILGADRLFKSDFTSSTYSQNTSFPNKESIDTLLSDKFYKLWDVNSFYAIQMFRDYFNHVILTNHNSEMIRAGLFEPSSGDGRDKYEILLNLFDFLKAAPNFTALMRKDYPQHTIFFKPMIHDQQTIFRYPDNYPIFDILLTLLNSMKLFPMPLIEMSALLTNYFIEDGLQHLKSLVKKKWLKKAKNSQNYTITEKTRSFILELNNLFQFSIGITSQEVSKFMSLVTELRYSPQIREDSKSIDQIKTITNQIIGTFLHSTGDKYPHQYLYTYLEFFSAEKFSFELYLQYLEVKTLEVISKGTSLHHTDLVEDIISGSREMLSSQVVSTYNPMINTSSSIINSTRNDSQPPVNNRPFIPMVEFKENVYSEDAINIIEEINRLIRGELNSDHFLYPNTSIFFTRVFMGTKRDEITSLIEELDDKISPDKTTLSSLYNE